MDQKEEEKNKYVELSSLLHKDIELNQDWFSNENETRCLMFLGVVSFLFIIIWFSSNTKHLDIKW
jgi:hypothetical protein